MRRLTARSTKMLLIPLLIVGCTIGLWLLQRDTAEEADQNASKAENATEQQQEVEDAAQPLIDQVLEVCAAGGPAARELEKAGACPAAEDAADVIQGETGATGAPGPPPSDAQVRRAVNAYCEDTGECQGQDGQSVTSAQVAAAVAGYCNDRGQCRGSKGDSGNPGAPGDQGAEGDQGPGPTADQINQAVAAFCADDACRGPEGTQGPTGPAGPEGSIGPAGVAGPEGPQGPAGPTCPNGYHIEQQTFITLENVTGIIGILCLAD